MPVIERQEATAGIALCDKNFFCSSGGIEYLRISDVEPVNQELTGDDGAVMSGCGVPTPHRKFSACELHPGLCQ